MTGTNGHSIERRLDRLESLWGSTDDDQADEDRNQKERSAALYDELLETMAPEHVQRLCDYLRRDDAGERSSDEGAARLLQVVNELVRAALNGRDNFKLALPEQVAEVYLSDRGHLFAQCRDCGLTLPFESEYWRGGVHCPEWLPFTNCPECGGSVGCWDKWMNGPTLSTPAQKKAATATW